MSAGGDERWERKAEIEKEGTVEEYRKMKGWHTDNDWCVGTQSRMSD